ncbi:MAG: hypothetical protein Q4E02_01505 [Lagierella massiliensis]|nr:hypothetical protein [Lagierella massiliensis]
MTSSIFNRKSDEKEQIEAWKKTIRIYFEGNVEYNEKLDFLKPEVEDEDIKKILQAFDNKYTVKDLKSLWEDIMVTAFSKDHRMVFVYDGKGKFTMDRKISLENYPKKIKLGYPRKFWIKKCEQLDENSTTALPNALKDSLVDILATKQGYIVIRIMHEEVDWSLDSSMDVLSQMINNAKTGKFGITW